MQCKTETGLQDQSLRNPQDLIPVYIKEVAKTLQSTGHFAKYSSDQEIGASSKQNHCLLIS